MKVIFLDFDGVLNSNAFLRALPPNDNPNRAEAMTSARMIDPLAVARLQRIVAATGAEVVISSTWRLYRRIHELGALLQGHGFKGWPYDLTPAKFSSLPRATEIDMWLEESDETVTGFVVLDDDRLAWIEGHTVLTDPEVGLTDADVEKAIAILGVAS